MKEWIEQQVALRHVVEAFPDATVVAHRDGRIVLANARAEQIFGYPSGTLVGQSVETLLPLQFRERHHDHRRTYFSAPTPGWIGAGRRLCGLRADGTEFPVTVWLSPIEADRGLLVAATVRPIHEDPPPGAGPSRADPRPGFEGERQLDRVIGGLAHHLNNLLTVILGYSELALGKVPPRDAVSASLGEVRQAAQRAAALVQQVLAWSRQQVLYPTVLDLNRLVADPARFKRLTGDKLEVVYRLAPDLDPVKADPGQLDQVVQALVRNAGEAMPEGGRLTVETANVELADARPSQPADVPAGRYAALAITDTGHGIAPENLPRIFEPFFTTKPIGHGVGLALSAAHGIVAQSGGYLTVESEPGKGSTFTIYLPGLDETLRTVGPDQARPLQETETTTILLVEDEHEVRGMFRMMLESLGYGVLEAASGLEALRLSRAHPGPIPLLLTDVTMPGMTGPAVAEILLRERSDLKVLFMSGYGGGEAIGEAGRSPRTAFLQKPFSREALLRMVQKLLDGPTAP
ncbi:MAG: ATP-binding protein [Nitrospirota bacterium]